jgi:hypothetical protein
MNEAFIHSYSECLLFIITYTMSVSLAQEQRRNRVLVFVESAFQFSFHLRFQCTRAAAVCALV